MISNLFNKKLHIITKNKNLFSGKRKFQRFGSTTSFPNSNTASFSTSKQVHSYTAEDVMKSRTLVEMQERACIAFSGNDIFGTMHIDKVGREEERKEGMCCMLTAYICFLNSLLLNN